MHLLHQPHNGERKFHLRARDRRRQLSYHRGHGVARATYEATNHGG